MRTVSLLQVNPSVPNYVMALLAKYATNMSKCSEHEIRANDAQVTADRELLLRKWHH